MLEMLGLLYTLDTDKYSYSPREVDRDWLDASGFHARAADAGLELTWAPIARVATLEYEKWLVVYEEDNKTHTKRKLQRRDTILMARKASRDQSSLPRTVSAAGQLPTLADVGFRVG